MTTAIVAHTTTRAPGSGDLIVDLNGWRASFLRYPFIESTKPRWVFAAREGKGPLRFGPRAGHLLALLPAPPTEEAILDFLRACLAGEIDTTALAGIPTVPST